ncbi:MAG: type II/IV secretion system protein [Candidatus Magnetominusculus sp. LBB02]|nr:type II/IV secretion system protein [Candidatus Magnetominusculus sp. LBB02]
MEAVTRTKSDRQAAVLAKLGEALLKAGAINETELSAAIAEQEQTGQKFNRILMDNGYATEMEIVNAIANNMGLEYVVLQDIEVEEDAIKAVPLKLVEKHLVMPVKFAGNRITIAMSDPLDLGAISDLEFVTGKKVHAVVTTLAEIRKATQHYYHNNEPKRLGEILIDAKTITQEQLDDCLENQKTSKKKLGDVIVQMGFSTEGEIAMALSSQLNLPYIDLASTAIREEAIASLTRDFVYKNTIIPISVTNRLMQIAMANPMDIDTIREIKYSLNKDVEVVISTPADIESAIKLYYGATDAVEDDEKDSKEDGRTEAETQETTADVAEVYAEANKPTKDSEAAPIVQLVNKIIFGAIKAKASDIHIEPSDGGHRVRLRVDGMMSGLTQISRANSHSVVSRIKVMAGLDITEKRIPQDGGIKVKVDGKGIDLRVSTLPTQFGEKIVIRILDQSAVNLSLIDIGLSDQDYRLLIEMIEKPQGFVIVTGPVGSGRSTTLYCCLHHLAGDRTSIITLENPVEHNIMGVNQVSINEKAGFTFPAALRSALRQDPDIIMLSEMHDPETAEIAIQASITGRLVITTMHTTTAVSALTMLRGMGIKTHLIATSLNGVVAQRLVRRLCQACKHPYKPTMEELVVLGLSGEYLGGDIRFYEPKGCDECGGTGYRGRIGIYEIMPATIKVKKLIYEEAAEADIFRAASEAGMISIVEDGLKKVMTGATSLDEVLRVTSNIANTEVILCHSCMAPLSVEYRFCPFCTIPLKHKCYNCGKQRNINWKSCPFCNTVFNG